MAIEARKPTTRRAVLAGALGGLAGWFGTALGRPEVARAGVDGDVVLGVENASASATGVKATASGTTALYGWSAAATGFGRGLLGQADNPTDGTTGVWGEVPGVSGATFGVRGISFSPQGTGVHGQGATGVRGVALTAGTGGWFSSGTGNALRVDGKVHLSRSGRATVTAGHSTASVSLTGTTTSSRVFAVLATNRSNRWVRAVVSGAGKFTIYLNATVTSKTYVNWFVLD